MTEQEIKSFIRQEIAKQQLRIPGVNAPLLKPEISIQGYKDIQAQIDNLQQQINNLS